MIKTQWIIVNNKLQIKYTLIKGEWYENFKLNSRRYKTFFFINGNRFFNYRK